ncbi:hypothetical protein Mapa_004057 [Marchantia paleacea]|nr:hypothetical protein Mapa_004057 [Marchantia paleacea]
MAQSTSGCLQAAVMKLVPCFVIVLLSQLVIPAHGQKARVAADIQTMLKVREELFGIPENKMILDDWSVEPYPCNWTRVECEGVGASATVRRIDLNQRNLAGPVPPSIGLLLNLTHISADGNRFDSIPSNFFKAKQLKFISFRNNLITGNVLDRLSAFQSLRVLLLGQNLLSGRIDSLSRLNRSAVQAIDLAGNGMQGNLSTLSGFTKLTILHLGQNQLTGELGTIRDMPSMYDLSLEDNNFTGSIPLSTLSGMISVNLSRNLLQGTFTLNEIFVPGTINSLDLSDNRFTEVVPEFLDSRNLSAQSTLDFFWARGVSKILLGGNGLTGSIGSFPESAATLNLSHNSLGGDLPQTGKATFFDGMETLLLNNNSFTGPIPAGFWTMANAVTMDLSRNQLNGTLPAGPVFMPSLQTLNLSWNLLSGRIPADISNMTRNFRLRTVDLSFNNLSGPLPPGLPQGDNYSYSFIGNPGLCSDDEFFRRAHLLVRCSKASKAAQALWAGVGSMLVLVLIMIGVLLVLWRKQVAKDNRMDADLVKAVNHGLISTRLIPLRQLKTATSNFAEEAKIGEGGFGSVYKGFLEGKEVAIKKSSNAILQLVASKQMFMNEVQIMSSVNHRYLVSLLGCCMTSKSALLVFEYVPQGTLAEHLYCRRGQGLDWNQRLKIARQTAEALSYLQFTANPPIYHRDVKSANILLDEQLNAKVADFGISKLAPNLDATTHYSTLAVQGTPGYIDPEYYVSYQMTGKSDVYSFGVVLLELITSRAPLDYRRGERDSTLVKMATHLVRTDALHLLVDPMLMIVFDDEEEVKKSILSVAELALRCVDRSPDDRPDMQQVAIEIEALSSVHYHVSKAEDDDMEVIPIANPVARRPLASYASATTGAGSMEFQSPFGR